MRTMISFAFTEFRRKRIIFWAALLLLVYIGLFGLIIHYAAQSGPGEFLPPIARPLAAAYITTNGLYGASFLVNLLSLFLGMGAVSSEIEAGTLHAVLSKPIRRETWFAGKWLGLALPLAACATLMWGSILLMGQLKFGFTWNWSLSGWLAVIGQPLLLLTLAMAGSTILSTMANGVFLVMLYGLAVIGGIIEQAGTFIQVPSMVQMGIISSLLLPVDSLYRRMIGSVIETPLGPLKQGLQSPFAGQPSPSNWMMVYVVVYGVGVLLLALRKFTKRDL